MLCYFFFKKQKTNEKSLRLFLQHSWTWSIVEPCKTYFIIVTNENNGYR